MESAGAAQCQEESERNPWFLHSAGVGGGGGAAGRPIALVC